MVKRLIRYNLFSALNIAWNWGINLMLRFDSKVFLKYYIFKMSVLNCDEIKYFFPIA